MSTQDSVTAEQATESAPVEEENNVTVVFTDGSELDVSFVVRLIGAEWVYAELLVESEMEDAHDIDDIVIRADEIRYIHSEDVASSDAESGMPETLRLHYSGGKPDGQPIWKAQHNLPPGTDPTEGSE